ncbi:MAG: hypothetical protein FWH31_04740 [Streptococcaceae bacterium]|nr:hypothetical protein [Streptococcaceae bacterium]
MSVKKYKKHKGYESLKREFLQRSTKDLSLEAIGLLSYMESMPDDYVFHKTQLYRNFAKNKKTSIERIWNELLDLHFIIAFSKGKAPKQEFEYLFSHEGFSEEEIGEINQEYLNNGWQVAYRSGSNRKPASYYQERKKAKKEAEAETAQTSNYQGVENQHPDNSGISLGVGFEQHETDSTKPTGIKFTTTKFNKKVIGDIKLPDEKTHENSNYQFSSIKTLKDFPLDFQSAFNSSFLTKNMVDLISYFGVRTVPRQDDSEMPSVDEIADAIFQEKARVDFSNAGKQSPIDGELWSDSLEQVLQSFVLKYKISQGVDKTDKKRAHKKIDKPLNYWHGILKNFWKNAAIIEAKGIIEVYEQRRILENPKELMNSYISHFNE